MCSSASTRSSGGCGSAPSAGGGGGGTSASTARSSFSTSSKLAAFGGNGSRGSGGASGSIAVLGFFFAVTPTSLADHETENGFVVESIGLLPRTQAVLLLRRRGARGLL